MGCFLPNGMHSECVCVFVCVFYLMGRLLGEVIGWQAKEGRAWVGGRGGGVSDGGEGQGKERRVKRKRFVEAGPT